MTSVNLCWIKNLFFQTCLVCHPVEVKHHIPTKHKIKKNESLLHGFSSFELDGFPNTNDEQHGLQSTSISLPHLALACHPLLKEMFDPDITKKKPIRDQRWPLHPYL